MSENIVSRPNRAVVYLAAIVGLGYGVVAYAQAGSPNGPAAKDTQNYSASGGSKIVSTLPAGTFQSKQVVRDLDRSATFYQRVFGIVPFMRFKSVMNHRPMEEILFNFPNGDHVPLVLIKFLDDGAVSHEQAVHVFFTDDIDALIDRVEQNGGQVTERRDDPEHRARIAFWRDPEGNLFETVQMD